MNNQVRSVVDNLLLAADSLDEMGKGVASIASISTRDAIRVDLVKFLIYLSNVDGVIEWEEIRLLDDYLDYDMPIENVINLAWDDEFIGPNFENEIPFSLKIFATIDNEMYKLNGYIEECATDLYIDVFEILGKELIASDYDLSDVEIEKLTEYIWNLKVYANNELIFKNGSSNDTQDEIAVNESEKTQITEKTEEPSETLESLLDELNSLTGLEDVKKDVNSLINLLQIRKIREERGMKQMPMSLHLVFSGNPGTGKTTVARLLAKIYHKLGVLSKGHLIEVDRSGLVGGYVGQTAIKVQEVLQKSLGGVLFIDEAYSLTANKGENDYGIEAVDTLLKGMEDHRDDLIVIVAGYPDLMNEFLNSNPGLRSRFNKYINFEDYKPNELVAIFDTMCQKSGYIVNDECKEYVKKYFEKRYLTRNVNFANGRDVRNFFELAIVNQANRLTLDSDITNEELALLVYEDVCDIII